MSTSLTQSQLDTIWALRNEGWTDRDQIGRKAGCSSDAVRNVISGNRRLSLRGGDSDMLCAAIERARELIRDGREPRDAAADVGMGYVELMQSMRGAMRYVTSKRRDAVISSNVASPQWTDEWWAENNGNYIKAVLAAHPEMQDVYNGFAARRVGAANRDPAREAMV